MVASGLSIIRGGQPRIAQHPIIADSVHRPSRNGLLVHQISTLRILLVLKMSNGGRETQTCGGASTISVAVAAAELPAQPEQRAAATNREDVAAASALGQLPIFSSVNASQYSSVANSLLKLAIVEATVGEE